MDQIETIMAGENGGIPNHPTWPAVLLRGICPGGDALLRQTFRGNGWGGLWTGPVFDYHHFHPASHEVLGVASGWARLHLGGPDGPTVVAEEGDVLVLPAGFGHKCVDASDGFKVVGGYPPGQESPEILRAFDTPLDAVFDRIADVPRPESDPVHGPEGPLRAHWDQEPSRQRLTIG